MAFPSIYDAHTVAALTVRINQLTASSAPQWGKMNVAQMLAHCNVTYEMAVDNAHAKPGAFQRFLAKLFAKKLVTSDLSYPKNSRTAPIFLVAAEQDFQKEKTRLINYLNKVVELGASHYDGKESISFGALSQTEWNNLMYKHLDHHLSQFGV